jgi:hypothetical protein
MPGRENEWLWGWDPTPGIVSVWAETDGRALVWRRLAQTGALLREEARFRPWVLIDRLDYVQQTGGEVTCRELDGPGSLRYLVSAEDGKALARAGRWRELGKASALVLPPEEQYLVSTGRTYFRDLSFDQLHRMQFDLETTGLDPERDRIFMIAVRDPTGEGADGRSGCHREPQPAWLRFAVSGSAGAQAGSSTGVGADRPAGIAAAGSAARDRQRE